MTDQERISAIRSRNEYLTGIIYRFYRDKFSRSLKKELWRDKEDILDIYQDAFMVVCNKIYENKLNENTLRSSLETYLHGVGKNLVYNVNRKKTPQGRTNLESVGDILDDEPGLSDENERIVQMVVNNMGEPCHSILLKQYWENKNTDEIAKEMNYRNGDVAKNQKYRCIQKLKSEIKGQLVYNN